MIFVGVGTKLFWGLLLLLLVRILVWVGHLFISLIDITIKYIKCLKHSYGMSTPRQNNPNSNRYFNNHLVPIMKNDITVAAITTTPIKVSNKRIQG